MGRQHRERAGFYNFNFFANNGFSVGEGQIGAGQGFSLTVNEAPSMSSANSTTFTVGNFGSFTMTADGSPAPTFSATGPCRMGLRSRRAES